MNPLTGRTEVGMLWLKAAAEATRRAATVRNIMVVSLENTVVVVKEWQWNAFVSLEE